MRKVRRDEVPRPVEAALWGLAAGRCEFNGCNRPLWKSGVTQEPVNIAEKAHIYAFSSGGPRGNEAIDDGSLNHFQNLMLVCHDCHRTIDKTIKSGGRYPAELLIAWKREHENRIELAGAIAPTKQSHVVLYGANIGLHKSPLHFPDAAEAMFPARYPAEHRAIELGMRNSASEDREPDYWEREAQNLTSLVRRRVLEPLADGLIGHLSIFALAPQPLLVLLGSLLVDIAAADVFQRRREPATWTWGEEAEQPQLIVRRPTDVQGPPALVISLSATIDLDRIRAVDPGLTIWQVTLDTPTTIFSRPPLNSRSFDARCVSSSTRSKRVMAKRPFCQSFRPCRSPAQSSSGVSGCRRLICLGWCMTRSRVRASCQL